MVKVVYCLKRLPQLSFEEFQKYWLEQHGPLTCELAPALGIKRYVQVHTIDTPVNERLQKSKDITEPAFDGVAEAWWDSMDDFLAARFTPEAARASAILREDEKKFIDPTRSAVWIAEVHELFEA